MLFSIALLKLKINEKDSSSIYYNSGLNRIFVFEIHRLLLWYHKKNIPLQSEIFKVGDGYGYQIELEDKVLIKQEYIPILEGNQPFTTVQDAERTANKVITKLLKKESPILTISELKELQIPEFNQY